MAESLVTLEQHREFILQQILHLPDFRSGSITAIRAPCGKPSCHCHQPHHPGHGPNYRREAIEQTLAAYVLSTDGKLNRANSNVKTAESGFCPDTKQFHSHKAGWLHPGQLQQLLFRHQFR